MKKKIQFKSTQKKLNRIRDVELQNLENDFKTVDLTHYIYVGK